ncbi:triose-phosphate isomerase [Aerococcaceae bacterium 50-4]
MVKLQNTFFIFNPKSYLYGESLLELAIIADKEAEKYPELSIFVTAPYADISTIASQTENVIVTAQHIDGIQPGRGMGAVLPASIKNMGAEATFLNHAEKPMTLNQLTQAISLAEENEIMTIVCADSIEEAKAIAVLNPTIILCEPTELIGTGKTSDEEYIHSTNSAIKEINSNVLVMQAAGISTPEDVFRTIQLGADGTGCTSGIVKAENPKQMLKDMIEAALEGSKRNLKEN